MFDIHNKLDKILNLLEKKDTSKSNFDSNMYIKCLIHELRTPITSVSLGLNLIENAIVTEIEKETKNEHHDTDNDDIHNKCQCFHILPTIKDLYKTIQHIENTLTKFCVIQDGNLTLNNFLPFSIYYLLDNVEKILQHNIKEKKIMFECNISEDVYEWVYGDKFNINHCILNLIKNAIKYGSNHEKDNKISVNVKIQTFDEEELIGNLKVQRSKKLNLEKRESFKNILCKNYSLWEFVNEYF